jgi:hypothetical protein
MAIAVLVMAGLMPAAGFTRDGIVIGGKIFTESYVLGEMAAQTIEADSSVPVTRKLGMGSTGILFEALKSGAIDVYPDYTGTWPRRSENRAQVAGGHPRVAVGDGTHHLGIAGVQRHLCAGGERRIRGKAQPAFDRRPDSHRVAGAGRIQLRIHGPQDGYPGLIDSYTWGWGRRT